MRQVASDQGICCSRPRRFNVPCRPAGKRVQNAAPAVQGLEKSTLPKNTRMVALGNRANFEFRAFQVRILLVRVIDNGSAYACWRSAAC